MAQTEYPPSTFDPTYLNPNEQDLLLNALKSNKPIKAAAQGTPKARSNTLGTENTTPDFYSASPMQPTPGSGNFETPYLDYDLDDQFDGNYDWEFDGQQLIGDLPGAKNSEDSDEPGDKRKNHPDDEDGSTRRPSEDKTNKKPGRKPLTSEPTSKRKAQNRAAQRAFRERKEQHLKELESKVDDLEKASESANHENGLLRAQVERLQTELREYRKRLSVQPPVNRFSPQSSPHGLSSKSQFDINNNFQFAFPKFWPLGADGNGLSTSRNGSVASPTTDTMVSQRNFMNPPASATFASPGMDELNGLFSPEILASVSSNSEDYANGQTAQSAKSPTAGSMASKVSERANSEINSNSPASSANNGFTSSCVTTPEYSAESPEQRKAGEAAFSSLGNSQRRKSSATNHDQFCKEFSKACGNKENPVPPLLSDSNQTPASTTSTGPPQTPLPDGPGFDWLATQNGGGFDPVLFGDYRDPQQSIMNGDFGGFFQDAFDVPDFPSDTAQPLESNLPKKRDLMKEIEDQQAGKQSEVVPGENPKQFLTCNMLWDRVQRSDKVQSGEADMDDLCSQLKAKAKCSGNGAVIDQHDVDAILGPAPAGMKDSFKMFK